MVVVSYYHFMLQVLHYYPLTGPSTRYILKYAYILKLCDFFLFCRRM